MRNHRSSHRKSFSPINLTNIIDVVFSILVVFMITVPLANEGLKVSLPKADSRSIEAEKTIKISVNSKRHIFINKKQVSLGSFRHSFQKTWTGNTQTVVTLNADKKVPYGFIIRLVEMLQKEGAQKIGFLTQPHS